MAFFSFGILSPLRHIYNLFYFLVWNRMWQNLFRNLSFWRTAPSDHHELVSALTALCSVMDSLATIGKDDHIFFPPHPSHMLNAEYALEAGSSRGVVDALQQIPHLSGENIEFLPSTTALCLVRGYQSVHDYRSERQMTPGVEDILMPPSAIRLSARSNYGHHLIYDASTKLVHPWEPFRSSDSPDDYRQVAGKPVWEVFGPIISSFQRLEYIGGAQIGVQFFESDEEYCADDPNGPPIAPDDMSDERREDMRKMHETIKAVWELKDIYLECGWDVGAEGPVQPTFRTDEFIERRRDHLSLG